MIKNLPANSGDARDESSVPGSGRSPGERNGNPLQYSCLENSMKSRVWQTAAHGVTERQTRLSTHVHTHTHTHTHSVLSPGSDIIKKVLEHGRGNQKRVREREM